MHSLKVAAKANDILPCLNIISAKTVNNNKNIAYLKDKNLDEYIVYISENPQKTASLHKYFNNLRLLDNNIRQNLPFNIPNPIKQDIKKGVFIFSYLSGKNITNFNDINLLNLIGLSLSCLNNINIDYILQNLPGDKDESAYFDKNMNIRYEAQKIFADISINNNIDAALKKRWQEALNLDELWEGVSPVLSHGGFSAKDFIISDNGELGILGWQNMKLHDAAFDLSYFMHNPLFNDADIDSIFIALARQYQASMYFLRKRAYLFSELNMADRLIYAIDNNLENQKSLLSEKLNNIATKVFSDELYQLH